MLSIKTLLKYKLLGLKISEADQKRLDEWDSQFESVKPPKKVAVITESKDTTGCSSSEMVDNSSKRVKNVVGADNKVYGDSINE